jgi:DNA-binding response OmpR family regulator
MLKNLFYKKESVKKILVVEDDAMLSQVLATTLKSEKFKVEVVPDGGEVLNAAIRFLPHLIVLDLILPGVDGFEVLKQLKAETKTASIPVIVLSNLNQASDIKSVKALGAEQYFLKATTELDVIVKYIKDKLNK